MPSVILGRRRFVLAAILGAVALQSLAVALSMGEHRGALIDDAFISFRYAERLATGRGLTFNDGERVEGYSNPLWTLTLAGAARVAGVRPHEAALPLSWAFLAGVAAVLALGRSWSGRTAVLLALGAGALDPGLLRWSPTGLEGAQSAFFVAAFLLACLRGPVTYSAGFAVGVAGGVVALCRPEAPLWVAVALAWLVWGAWIPGRALLGVASGLLPVYGSYTAVRAVVFGRFLPNTFHAKMEADALGVGEGVADVGGWLLAHSPLVALVLAIRWGARRSEDAPVPGGRNRTGILLLLPGSLLAAQALFVLLAGGDWMGDDRYWAPLAPALGVGAALAWPRSRQVRGARTLVAMVLLSSSWGLGWGLRDPVPSYTAEGEELGRWLRGVAKPDDLVALTAAGAVPYFSGLPVYDALGITDPEVVGRAPRRTAAWAPGHARFDLRRLLERKPDWIVWDFGVRVNRYRMQQLLVAPVPPDSLDYRRGLFALPEFRERYRIDTRAPAQGTYTVFRREE